MATTIKINHENFEIICRSTENDVDRAEAISSIARNAAAVMAASEGLPHYTCDVKIGEQFEYRENISAFVPTTEG